MTRPLFVIGSKRSGSTLTVHLLNTHPRVFVSHESDVAWLLYQHRDGRPARVETHPLDSDMMLRRTTRVGRRALRRLGPAPDTEAIRAAFLGIQAKLVRRWVRGQRLPGGGPWRVFQEVGKRPTPRRLWAALTRDREVLDKQAGDLAWLGDKKHAQMLDPDVRAFLAGHFPDARSVHVVRDPRGVVASMRKAQDEWLVKPEFFAGSAAEILGQWADVEERVLAAKEAEAAPILTVRLEDLWCDPRAEMARILGFLDLDLDPAFERWIPKLVQVRDPNKKYDGVDLPDVPRARALMERYGYA